MKLDTCGFVKDFKRELVSLTLKSTAPTKAPFQVLAERCDSSLLGRGSAGVDECLQPGAASRLSSAPIILKRKNIDFFGSSANVIGSSQRTESECNKKHAHLFLQY